MKKYMVLSILLLSFNGVALADKVVTAPITVDANGNYTVVETSGPVKDVSYYTYAPPAQNCYTSEQPGLGVNLLGTFVGVGGSSKVYCYPAP